MNDTIVVALIGTFGVITVSVVTVIGSLILRKVDGVHLLINSRMDELLREARQLARAEGYAAGTLDERLRERETA